MLPACDFRGQETVDHKNRQRYECTHPKMLQGSPVVLVSSNNCLECQYCTFDVPSLIQGYRKDKATRVEPEEFVRRVTACDVCPERKGNYCPILGGCGLASKLRFQEISCPQQRF